MKTIRFILFLVFYSLVFHNLLEGLLNNDIKTLKFYTICAALIFFIAAAKRVTVFIEEQVADQYGNQFPLPDNLLIFPDAAK